MKRLPLILAALFLAITLARVAEFVSREMSAGFLGWVFAPALGAAVYTVAYYTRQQTTRKAAMVGLLFFVLVDAFLNFAEVWLTSSHDHPLTIAGAAIYGLFPTAAVALLGWLQTSIAKMPPTKNEAKVKNAWADWLADRLQVEAKPTPEPVAASEPEPEKRLYVCGICGFADADTQNGLNAHMKKHATGNGYHPEQAKVLEEK